MLVGYLVPVSLPRDPQQHPLQRKSSAQSFSSVTHIHYDVRTRGSFSSIEFVLRSVTDVDGSLCNSQFTPVRVGSPHSREAYCASLLSDVTWAERDAS